MQWLDVWPTVAGTYTLLESKRAVVTVLAFARTDTPTVTTTDTVQVASRRMAEAGVDSVVVVSAGSGGSPDSPDDRRVAGVVEDRDVVRLVRAGGDPATTAATAIDCRVETISADAGVFEAVRRLDETGARCLPVVADGELRGVVTPSDIVVLLAEEIGEVAGTVDFDPDEPLASEHTDAEEAVDTAERPDADSANATDDR